MGDTGYGWGVPVDLGLTMSTLQAKNAVHAGNVLTVLGDLLPVCAVGSRVRIDLPYMCASISVPTPLSFRQPWIPQILIGIPGC